jgi:hypothetical protein
LSIKEFKTSRRNSEAVSNPREGRPNKEDGMGEEGR